MATEEAKYTQVAKDGACELRDYAAHVVADVEVQGALEEAGNKAFRILFAYISGANVPKAEIPMTAPVTQEKSGSKIPMTAPVEQKPAGTGWTVSFVMPATYTLDTTPAPADKRVTIRAVPARRLAAIRYSGTWSEKNYRKHKAEFDAWLAKKGYTVIGDFIWARYNAPFTPWFLRRNEILVPVKADLPAPAAPAR